MNDKDKEAFEKWFAQNPVNKLEAEEAWQAACEYKQKEIDALKLEIMQVKADRNKAEFKLAVLKELEEK